MRFLLDTNIVSDLVRNPQGTCSAKVAEVGEDNVCTSIVVSAELRYGAAKRRSARLSRQLEEVLAALRIVPFEKPQDEAYGELRAKLDAAGTPVGSHDMLIASQTLALRLVLVTDNDREFVRIQGLKIENWLRQPR